MWWTAFRQGVSGEGEPDVRERVGRECVELDFFGLCAWMGVFFFSFAFRFFTYFVWGHFSSEKISAEALLLPGDRSDRCKGEEKNVAGLLDDKGFFFFSKTFVCFFFTIIST